MKVWRTPTESERPLIPSGSPEELRVTSLRSPGIFVDSLSESILSTCLRCPERFCGHFTEEELGLANRITSDKVCPVDAITFQEARPKISDACIHCGLCVVRCPYGSLFLDNDLRPSFDPVGDDSAFEEVDLDSFSSFGDQLTRTVALDDDETSALMRAIQTSMTVLRKDEFYPLIGCFLTASGFPTVISRIGDTSNRFDAVMVDSEESLPLELKAPREVMYVNIKSVQQALENKVILDSRAPFPSVPTTSTLVVGYEYPAERSDVLRLVDDIAKAYEINIGLLDLAAVYRLMQAKYLEGVEPARSLLTTLKGML